MPSIAPVFSTAHRPSDSCLNWCATHHSLLRITRPAHRLQHVADFRASFLVRINGPPFEMLRCRVDACSAGSYL